MFLITTVNYSNQERGEEYSPTHFVLQLDKGVIELLQKYLRQVKKIKEPDFIRANFFFGFGVWVRSNKWLKKNCNKAVTFYKGNELPVELEEQDDLDCYQISIDYEGAIQFLCFGEYDREKIYTCDFFLKDLKRKMLSPDQGV